MTTSACNTHHQSEQKPETRTQNAAFCCSHLKKIRMVVTCSLAGMSSLGRSGRCIHTAETRPTADPTGNRGGCPRKQIPEKTERAAETDRPLGFRLWEIAMGNRSRNPMGNRRLVSALSTNGITGSIVYTHAIIKPYSHLLCAPTDVVRSSCTVGQQSRANLASVCGGRAFSVMEHGTS